MATELDYMEYANDADAQAAYVTNAGIDSDTKLLIHFDGADGATIYTAETGQTVTFSLDAQLDTAQKEFGTASLLLDGVGDTVSVPDSDDWYYAQAPFTVDFWVRFNDVTGNQEFWAQKVDGNHSIECYFDGTADKIYFYDYSDGFVVYFTCPFNPSVDTWYHIAFVRVNTDNAATGWRIFVDGSSQTLTLAGGAWNATLTDYASTLSIGSNDAGGNFLDGWIDEFRVSKGVARWSSNFTPPTSPYSLPLVANAIMFGFAF